MSEKKEKGRKIFKLIKFMEGNCDDPELFVFLLNNWDPFSEIDLAFEIVDVLIERKLVVFFNLSYDDSTGKYKFSLREYYEILNVEYWPEADTPAQAICESVLKLIKGND